MNFMRIALLKTPHCCLPERMVKETSLMWTKSPRFVQLELQEAVVGDNIEQKLIGAFTGCGEFRSWCKNFCHLRY